MAGWWKFTVRKLFTLNSSSTHSSARRELYGPRNLKHLWLFMPQALLAPFDGLDRNDVAALKFCARRETATDFGNLLSFGPFGEKVACTVNALDFNRDNYGERLFALSFACDYFRRSVLVLGQEICPAHRMLICKWHAKYK